MARRYEGGFSAILVQYATGAVGLLVGGLLAYTLAERLERQTRLLIAALTTLLGGIISAAAGHSGFGISVVGIFLIWIGIAIFTPISSVWSTENFPTRARTVGFALGGWGFFLLLGGYYLVASGVSRLGSYTRNKRLEEVAA